MRISDWSSDVCSSDLDHAAEQQYDRPVEVLKRGAQVDRARHRHRDHHAAESQLGRREIERGDEDADREDDQARRGGALRSEEHTSELQSLMRISYAVFCLENKTPKKR